MKDKIMQMVGGAQPASYELCTYSAGEVRWISRETDSDGNPRGIREPEEKNTVYPYPGSFMAAGKTYRNWRQLCVEEDKSGHFCKDIYGREVLALWERFPCFDSYDYLYENRYFRWFFLRENGKLTRIFYTDEQDKIHITEDVRKLENKCWIQMEELDYWK